MPTQEEVLKANEAELVLKSDGFREDLHKAIRILPEVERHLRIIIEKGKITKAQIEKLRVLNRAIKP